MKLSLSKMKHTTGEAGFGEKIHEISVGHVKCEMLIMYLGTWIHEFTIYKREFFWR